MNRTRRTHVRACTRTHASHQGGCEGRVRAVARHTPCVCPNTRAALKKCPLPVGHLLRQPRAQTSARHCLKSPRGALPEES